MDRINDLTTHLGGAPYPVGIHPKGILIPKPILDTIGTDQLDLSTGQPKKKFSIINAIGNFLKGGVVDTIKGLFSFNGLMAMGLSAAGVALLGPAAIPYLLGIGAVTGGLTVAKGALTAYSRYRAGDTEGAENAFRTIGSGFVGTALSLFGLRKYYSSGAVKTVYTDKAGVQTNSVEASKTLRGTLKHLWRDVTLRTRVEGTDRTLWGHMTHTTAGRIKSFGSWLKERTSGIFGGTKPATTTGGSQTATTAANAGEATVAAETGAAADGTVNAAATAVETQPGAVNTATLMERAQAGWAAARDYAGKTLTTIRELGIPGSIRAGFNRGIDGIRLMEGRIPGIVPFLLIGANQRGNLQSQQEQLEEDYFYYRS